MDKPIHPDLETLMQERSRAMMNAGDGELLRVTADGTEDYTAQVIVPILSAGDAIGAVMLLSRDEDAHMEDSERKVCETAAYFMGKQMEN